MHILTCLRACVSACVRMCLRVCVRICVYMCVCMCLRACAYVCVCAFTAGRELRARTHAHTEETCVLEEGEEEEDPWAPLDPHDPGKTAPRPLRKGVCVCVCV